MPAKKHLLKWVNRSALSQDEYNLNTVKYGIAKVEFGNCLIAANNNKICWLSFFDTNEASAISPLEQTFGHKNFVRDDRWSEDTAQEIFKNNTKFKFEDMMVVGTEFQKTVWQALCAIPYGSTVSYSDVAKAIGNPKATRAVASAIAKNNISFLIPCHRVIRKSGQIHKYRWGAHYKEALLAWEQVLDSLCMHNT